MVLWQNSRNSLHGQMFSVTRECSLFPRKNPFKFYFRHHCFHPPISSGNSALCWTPCLFCNHLRVSLSRFRPRFFYTCESSTRPRRRTRHRARGPTEWSPTEGTSWFSKQSGQSVSICERSTSTLSRLLRRLSSIHQAMLRPFLGPFRRRIWKYTERRIFTI